MDSIAGLWFCLVCICKAQSECSPPEGADVDLARYLYELAQNRNPDCQPGGNYIADPSAEDLQLQTTCWKVLVRADRCIYPNFQIVDGDIINHPMLPLQDQGNGVSDIEATYSFIQCDGEPNAGKLANLKLTARVKKCPESDSILQQPMNVQFAAFEAMPKDCGSPEFTIFFTIFRAMLSTHCSVASISFPLTARLPHPPYLFSLQLSALKGLSPTEVNLRTLISQKIGSLLTSQRTRSNTISVGQPPPPSWFLATPTWAQQSTSHALILLRVNIWATPL